jgi:hypothetical protein
MPADESEWVKQSPEQLAIRHCAYWLSLEGFPEAAARSSTRLEIPLENVFSAEAVASLMQRLQERNKP